MDTLNILHLEKRTDRKDALLIQLEQQNITDYKIWEGVIVRKSRRTGITIGHKKIVQWAKDNNLERCIIGEDDLQFFGLGAWDYYLSKIPEDYDLFFGMIYVSPGLDENYQIHGISSGMTLYTIHKRFYDVFLSLPDDSHVDRDITKLHEQYKFFVCKPFVCQQTGSFSDNCLRKCTYTPLLEGRELFGR